MEGALFGFACLLAIGLTEARIPGPARLAALVDYVGADYPGAVRNGKVIAAPEYREQLTLVADALQLAVGLAPAAGHEQARAALASELARLKADLEARAPTDRIVGDCAAIHRRLVDDYGLVLTPLVPPDLERARTVYAQSCAACHGARGRADTAQARQLKPPPVSFFDRQRMERISPALAFHAITFGVAGTAMAAFETLPASDRWSLAFYVVSLRHSAAAAARGAEIVEGSGLPVASSASRLAGISDLQLDELLRTSERSASRRAAVVSYLRRIAAFAAEPGGAFVVARRLLAEVGDAAGDPDKAAELAQAAYLDGIEPHEAVLNERNRPLATRLESSMARLQQLIKERADPGAVREQVGRALMLLDRVEEEAAAARPTASGRAGAERSSEPGPRLVGQGCPADQPGVSQGLPLRRSPGMPAFDAFWNCVYPKKAGLAIAVRLRGAPPSRERVSALVGDLWTQARTAMGKDFPRLVQICAFPAGTTMWSANFLACAKAGFEPPGEEPDELGPEFENNTPYSLAEEAARLLQDRAERFPGRHKLRVTVDQHRREFTVQFPYLEPGEDRWARKVTFVDAVAPFFSVAGDTFTSSVPAPKSLTFVGTWKGRAVLRVRLQDERAFRALDQWPMLERLHRADHPDPEMVRREYERSLSRLPKGSVWVDRRLEAGL